MLKLANAMDKALIFKTGKIDEFESRLKQLASQLDGFSRSFQCTLLALYYLLQEGEPACLICFVT